MKIVRTKHYNKWHDEEDCFLEQLVQKYGQRKWNDISKQLKVKYNIQNRTGKQCRQRWLNLHSKSHRLPPLSSQDDKKLLELFKLHGTKWSLFAKQFYGRGDNQLKNRFYSLVRKSLRQMCKYSNIKTSDLDVYSAKAAAFTLIFSKGLNAPEQEGCLSDRIDQVQDDSGQKDYKELTQTIILFIFKDFKEEQMEIQKQKVIEVLRRIMKIQETLNKEEQKKGERKLAKDDFKLNKKIQSKRKNLRQKEKIFTPKFQQAYISETMEIESDINGGFEPYSQFMSYQIGFNGETSREIQMVEEIKSQNPLNQKNQDKMILLPSMFALDNAKYLFLKEDKQISFQYEQVSSPNIKFNFNNDWPNCLLND